jgi:hypothetical protein
MEGTKNGFIVLTDMQHARTHTHTQTGFSVARRMSANETVNSVF